MIPRCTPSLTSSCRQSAKFVSLRLLQLSIFALICVKSFQAVNHRLEKTWTSWESDVEKPFSYVYTDHYNLVVGRCISIAGEKSRYTFYSWRGFKPEICHLKHPATTMIRVTIPNWLASV